MSKELISYKKLKVKFTNGARLLNNELYGIDSNSLVFLYNMASLSPGCLEFLDKRAEHIFKFRDQVFLVNKNFCVRLTGNGEYSYDSLIEINMSMPKECNEAIYRIDDSNSDGVLFYTKATTTSANSSKNSVSAKDYGCCYFLDRNFEISQFINNFTLVGTAQYKEGLSFLLTDKGSILLGKSVPTITNSVRSHYREIYTDKGISAIYTAITQKEEILVAVTADSLIKYKIVNVGGYRRGIKGELENNKISLIQEFKLKYTGECCEYLGDGLFAISSTQLVDMSQDVPLVRYTFNQSINTFTRLSNNYILADDRVIKFFDSADDGNSAATVKGSPITNVLSFSTPVLGDNKKVIEQFSTLVSDKYTSTEISDALAELPNSSDFIKSLDESTKNDLGGLLIKADRFSRVKKMFTETFFSKLIDEQGKLKQMHKAIVNDIEKLKVAENFIRNEIDALYNKGKQLKVESKEFYRKKMELDNLLEKATVSFDNASTLLAKLKVQRSVLREML